MKLLLSILVIYLALGSALLAADVSYNRAFFGRWPDTDRDCLNTRQELLEAQSLQPTIKSASGCRILRGQWRDPYSGQLYFEARDLQIDHLVPLKFAWAHGANRWPRSRARAFFNEPGNLIVTEGRLNAQKGARVPGDGPGEWLPPQKAFRCEYTLRFLRISKKYDLQLTGTEQQRLAQVRADVCA